MSEQQGIKPYVIGLDLGGTNSVFGIVDSRGDIKTQTAIKTGGYTCAEEMKLAAAEALAALVSDDEINENFIMPEAFDPRVAEVVSEAVKSHIS